MNDNHDDPRERDGRRDHARADRPGRDDRLDDFGPADPRFERLVALLYNELSADEAEAVHREIAADPELRVAWEEIRSARASLADLPIVESAGLAWDPLDPRDEAAGAIGSARSAATRPKDDRSRLGRVIAGQPSRAGGGRVGRRDSASSTSPGRGRRWATGTAWGVAAAALLLLSLGLARFRVERLDRGLAFTVGAPARVTSREVTAPIPAAPAEAAAVETAPAGSVPGRTVYPGLETAASRDIATPPGATYVTREELHAYSAELTRSLAVALDERASQRDADLAAWMQVAFQEVSRRQAAGYGDLRGRIEEVGVGLARGQDDANERINLLLRQDRAQPNMPAILPVTGEEGEKP